MTRSPPPNSGSRSPASGSAGSANPPWPGLIEPFLTSVGWGDPALLHSIATDHRLLVDHLPPRRRGRIGAQGPGPRPSRGSGADLCATPAHLRAHLSTGPGRHERGGERPGPGLRGPPRFRRAFDSLSRRALDARRRSQRGRRHPRRHRQDARQRVPLGSHTRARRHGAARGDHRRRARHASRRHHRFRPAQRARHGFP